MSFETYQCVNFQLWMKCVVLSFETDRSTHTKNDHCNLHTSTLRVNYPMRMGKRWIHVLQSVTTRTTSYGTLDWAVRNKYTQSMKWLSSLLTSLGMKLLLPMFQLVFLSANEANFWGTSIYSYVKPCHCVLLVIVHNGHAHGLSNLWCSWVDTACTGSTSCTWRFTSQVRHSQIKMRVLWCCSCVDCFLHDSLHASTSMLQYPSVIPADGMVLPPSMHVWLWQICPWSLWCM